jgi:ABC-2 type transport system permease protein
MSAVSAAGPSTGLPRERVQSQPVTLGRAVRAEWVKWRSLRSTWAVLGVAVLGMVVIACLVAYNTRHLSTNLQANDLAPSATMQGYYLGQLLIGALGVLFVSGEYGTGMIRSTLAAVPRRVPVLWAKLIVFVAVVAVSMVTVCLVAYLASQGLLSHYRTGYSLSDPGVLRVVVGTGIYLTLVGMIGAALGWIVRSTPGALVAYVGVVLVIPVLFGDALGTVGKKIAEFTPTQAGAAFSTSIPDGPSLHPYVGLAVMAAWVVVALGAAVWVLRRRDA